MAVLVLADHDQGQLSASTSRIVAGAEMLGPVVVLVAGQAVRGVAEQASRMAGVSRVLVVESESLANAAPDVLADLLAGLAEPYTHLVAASDAVGRDVMPRLAARLDVMPVTDIVAIHSPNRFDRPVYAGNAIETLVSADGIGVLTLRAATFHPARTGNGAPIEVLDVQPPPGGARFIAAMRTEGDRPELSSANIVVAGGVGVGSAEGFRLIETLAARLGAAVGATRAAVDAGYAPNDWQVGQTGKIIAPDLYIGIGISGALQHLAGIGGARRIIAVNTDPEAPLMKLADFALVGDLFEVIPALIVELDRLGVPAK